MFPPPPVQGLGTIGGFKLQVEDRADLGYEALDEATKAFLGTGHADARARRPVLDLPDQRAAALCRHRPHQGAAARRRGDGRVRDDADLSRLALRQRLQPLRPHLLGARAGRRAVPRPRRRRRPAQDAHGDRRDGAAGRAAAGEAERRARTAPCATTASSPPTSTAAPAPGFSSGQAQAAVERIAARDAAAGLRLRMDRADLPGDPRRQLRAAASSRSPSCSCSWCSRRCTRAWRCRCRSS